ncbi:MAG: hypothetical protein HGA45_13990 [Chloroflexales bacterium]|nr:hypothetical protein [Chloroflexales bacterium]
MMTEQQDRWDQYAHGDQFWEWFTSQSDVLAALLEQDDTPRSANPNPLWAELHTRLCAVHPDLRITVVRDPDGPVGLISATGVLANIAVVARVIIVGPPIPGWRIAPFREVYDRQRGFFHFAADLPIDDIGFTIVATGAGLRLVVYTADHPDTDPDVRRRGEMMLRLMYDREVIDRFAEVVWRQAPQAFREEEQIYPLNELLEVLSGLTTVVERWLEQEAVFAS